MGLFHDPLTLAEFRGDPNAAPELTGLTVVIPPDGRFYIDGRAVVATGGQVTVTYEAGEIVAGATVAPDSTDAWHDVSAAAWVYGEPGTAVTLRMAIDGEYQLHPAVPKLEATTQPRPTGWELGLFGTDPGSRS